MKTTFLFCLMLGVSAFSHPAELVDEFDVELEEQWTLFKYTHNRQYANKNEESMRKNIFEKNLKMVQKHNLLHARGLKSFTMALNRFSDMTSDERSSLRGVKISSDYKRTGEKYVSPMNLGELPKELDWRTKGLVTRVKDQNPCGSCYAFSAVGAIEAQHARKTGQLVSLSEQDIVDCSFKYGNNGCNGGLPDYVFNYVIDNGIDTEASYQYIRDEQKCKHRNDTIGATIKALVDVESGNEQQLLEAVATVGPVSVGIDADHNSFVHYAGGVYEEPMCSHEDLDHGVLVVGYGTEDGKDYWLVKNSWGEDWGDKGYIKIKRNENYCGIALLPSYPVV